MSSPFSELHAAIQSHMRNAFGEPHVIDGRNDEWSLRPTPDVVPINVLVNGPGENPLIWVFDPHDLESGVKHTRITSKDEIHGVVAEIRQRMNRAHVRRSLARAHQPVPLGVVICTDELRTRPARPHHQEALDREIEALKQEMANKPEKGYQPLVDCALRLCGAQSSGISILEMAEDGSEIFRWHALAGRYAAHHWQTTPRDFSPCGTVLDWNASLLMRDLDRHFTYFAKVEPRIVEALLAPFYKDGVARGTVWAVLHDYSRGFDAEDQRVLQALSECAGDCA